MAGHDGGRHAIGWNAAAIHAQARARQAMRVPAWQGAASSIGSVTGPTARAAPHNPVAEKLPGQARDGRRQVMDCASSVVSDTGPAASNVATV
jgi:hypothetical protein